MQVIFSVAPQPLLEEFHSSFLSGDLPALASHPSANFALQAFLAAANRSPLVKKLLAELKKATESAAQLPPTSSAIDTVPRPVTRSLITPVGLKDEKCILCTGPATRKHALVNVQTKEFSTKVHEYATALGDHRIIGILEKSGDLIALEAKYHKRCYTSLSNRFRTLNYCH